MSAQTTLFIIVLGVVMGILATLVTRPFLTRDKQTAGLIKIQGHSQFYERLVPIAIIAGSTTLSAIAAYVFAQDQILKILGGGANLADIVVFALVASTGIIVDIAMIISASRFQMHLLRGKSDRTLALLTGGMFFLCLFVEAITLGYFYYLADPGPFTAIADAIKALHSGLYFARFLLLPLIIGFFVTCVKPLVISASDRRAATYARTSQDIAQLEITMTSLDPKITRQDKLDALAAYITQIRINEYAFPGTSESLAAEAAKNAQLIEHLKADYGYVSASELATLVTQAMLLDHTAQAQVTFTTQLADLDTAVTQRHAEAMAHLDQRLTAQHAQIQEANHSIDDAKNAAQSYHDVAMTAIDALQQQINEALEGMSQRMNVAPAVAASAITQPPPDVAAQVGRSFKPATLQQVQEFGTTESPDGAPSEPSRAVRPARSARK